MDDYGFIGFILLTVSIVGVVCNWTFVVLTSLSPSLRQPFALLTANQVLLDSIHSTLILTYVAPMLITNNRWMIENSGYCGIILLTCYDLSTQSHLIIAFNRFFAVFTPGYYPDIFSNFSTKIIIFIMSCSTIVCDIVIYQKPCYFYFHEQMLKFIYTDSPSCSVVFFNWDFIRFFGIVITTVLLDLVIILKVQIEYWKNRRSGRPSFPQLEQINKMNSLIQTCCQDALFATAFVTYFIVSPFVDDEWTRFMLSLFAWVFVHAADGVIAIVFNSGFRRFLRKHRPKLGFQI